MLRSRFSNNVLLVAISVVFAVLGDQTTSADGDRPIFLRFAGDLIQNLEQTDVDVFGMPIGSSNLALVRG